MPLGGPPPSPTGAVADPDPAEGAAIEALLLEAGDQTPLEEEGGPAMPAPLRAPALRREAAARVEDFEDVLPPPKKKRDDKTRAYAITFYGKATRENGSPSDLDDQRAELELIMKELHALQAKGTIKYFVAGRETCPTTARPHLQAYVNFANARQFSAVKKMWKTAHIEIAAANAQANRTYCVKDGNFEEAGEFPKTISLKDRIELYANNNVIVID